ncbi:MAG: hypothetical protein M3Q50_00670 [Chloroflexota bacterium]|nr:hypothetical protein [Chloroflexota bacterium]
MIMLAHAAGAIAIAALSGCSNDGPTAPRHGTIRVTIQTSGGDPDDDGYELVVGSTRRLPLTRHTRVIVVDSVAAGTFTVALEKVADNCTVTGTNPRPITITSGETAMVDYSVACEATGIEVVAKTSGSDFPFGFDVTAGGRPAGFIKPNASVIVSRFLPGSYTVSLNTIADNCSVAGGNSATVGVSNRAVTRATFDIACLRSNKHIAFVLNLPARGKAERWIMVADSSGRSVVPLVLGHGPAWSPDGKQLVYSTVECDDYYGTCSDGGLVVIDPETRTTIVAVNGPFGTDPAWSPDGRFIAYSRTQTTRSTTLHVAGLDGSPSVELATPEIRYVRRPSWSPDGRRIVFGCQVQLGPQKICSINRDGTGFMRLTSDAAEDGEPAWSPDGSRIAFTTSRFTVTAGTDVAFMTASGTGITRLTSGFDPGWSADGSRLLFARNDGIYRIDSNGLGLTKLTNGAHTAPAWRP